jgi:hypothetical protein
MGVPIRQNCPGFNQVPELAEDFFAGGIKKNWGERLSVAYLLHLCSKNATPDFRF